MKTIDYIKNNEGFRSKPYLDNRGNLTVGYGHLLERHSKKLANEFVNASLQNNKDTKFQRVGVVYATTLLRKDIKVAREIVANAFPRTKISCPRKTVMIDMAFNLGQKGFLGFHRMIYFVKHGLYQLAADEILKSLLFKENTNRTLVNADIMRSNKFRRQVQKERV